LSLNPSLCCDASGSLLLGTFKSASSFETLLHNAIIETKHL
jgi:hypothetical protein